MAETDTNDPDLTQVIEDMAPLTHHVHCRVGYDHGPQVPDPRKGQWLGYTEGHERWWDAIWTAAKARGDTEVCFTTEFGPPNYQVFLHKFWPHSQVFGSFLKAFFKGGMKFRTFFKSGIESTIFVQNET